MTLRQAQGGKVKSIQFRGGLRRLLIYVILVLKALEITKKFVSFAIISYIRPEGIWFL
jgi:hypothetical protein